MLELRGSLEGIGLRSLLDSLEGLRASGNLQVVDGRWTGTIALAEGRVVGATFGTEQGLPALEAVCLGLPRGHFSVSQREATFQVNLVLEPAALRERLEAWECEAARLWAAVPSLEAVPRVRHGDDRVAAGEITLRRRILSLLLALDGRRSVAALAQERGLVPALRGLAELAELGLVEFQTPSTEDTPAIRTSPEPDAWGATGRQVWPSQCEPQGKQESGTGEMATPGDGVIPAAVATSSSAAMALHLRAVSYRYPESQKVALADVSYTFRAGTTAIVGPNGAGKSTLVKLLTGLLEPTSGSIRVRLPSGACLPPDQVHKAVLFQEPSHLHLSVRQNITMRYDRTPDEDARIHHALEVAGLGRVVEELPDGIDTLVGAGFGGQLDLSGGQWQRLALARLVYQDAPVMILDEPIASLDPEGERAVFELFAHLTDKIIIFTTHRYDSIPPDTPIVVLVDGRITEAGTHEELLERQRDYVALYMAGSWAARGLPRGRAAT